MHLYDCRTFHFADDHCFPTQFLHAIPYACINYKHSLHYLYFKIIKGNAAIFIHSELTPGN